MHHLPAGVLVLLLSMSTGCRRPAPPSTSPAPASPPESAAQSAPVPSATTDEEAPRLRPEQAAAAAAAAQRQTPSTPERTATAAASVPETRQQGVALMQTIDRDIADQELEPGAALHLRASFRGRLLAAGVDQSTIEDWTSAKFIP